MSCGKESSVGPWNDKSLLAQFREAILTEHNSRRAKHGNGDLKLCNSLNNYAQEWALLNAGMEQSIHRSDRDLIYGENLHRGFWHSTPVNLMAQLIVNDFYNEIANYQFGPEDPIDLASVSHFTQMIWHDTTEMGVGIAEGESGFVYCVVNYNPRGNVNGEFSANVFPSGTVYKPKETDENSKLLPPPINNCSKSPYINIFRKKLTEQHNIHRKRHGVPFLKNAESLNQLAQSWAIHLAQQDCVEHSHSSYGESIYQLVTSDPNGYPTPISVCNSFAYEAIDYVYGTEDTEQKAGHYTQLVWKDTSALGIGIQKAASGNVYVVCYYNPPGNREGMYATNVLPPITLNRQPKKKRCAELMTEL